LISVIGISTKHHIGATLLIDELFTLRCECMSECDAVVG